MNKKSSVSYIFGVAFFILFMLIFLYQFKVIDIGFFKFINEQILNIISIVFFSLFLMFILPYKKREEISKIKTNKLSKRTLIATFFILILVPVTIFSGIYLLDNKKFYIISLLIILEIFVPFIINFEEKKPQARELIIISVLCAVAVSGRIVFASLPQFKPIVATVIIAGVCFGAETGFLVGAVSGFVSNFYFMQGPWTPWQMFALGLVGFVGGIIFNKGFIKTSRLSLSIFGFFAILIIYAGILNPSSALLYLPNPTFYELFIASMVSGFIFDLVHAVSTAFFLYFISEPLILKLERVKTKYGLK